MSDPTPIKELLQSHQVARQVLAAARAEMEQAKEAVAKAEEALTRHADRVAVLEQEYARLTDALVEQLRDTLAVPARRSEPQGPKPRARPER
jgi:hypothetical protein